MPRRTAEQAAETRLALIRAGRKLFSDLGFEATTARALASGAGVTTGAVFHHFGSMRGLFAAVFEEIALEMDAHARAAAAVRGVQAEPLEAFIDGVRAYLEFAARPDFNRIFLIDGPKVLGDDEWHRLDTGLGLKTVAGSVIAMKKAGQIPDQPTKPLAILLFGALNEAGFALARHEADFTVEDAINGLRLLLRKR